jgi:bifunctional non-homologous end joining protein LigD
MPNRLRPGATVGHDHGMVVSSLVRPVRPMLATPGQPPAGPEWAFEFKWDGVRAILDVTPVGTTVVSRNGNDVTASYPELAILRERLAGRLAVLDGEIVTLDVSGRPSFTLLQQRMHVRVPSVPLLARVPVQLYLFDILALDDRILVGERYDERRRILDGLALDDDDVVKVPPVITDMPGTMVLHTAASHGLEGVVAKRLDSVYQPGARTRGWIKTPLEHTTEAVIVGWTRGGGRREGTIGALLLGTHDARGRLVYVGNVGTGFTDPALRDLQAQLAPLHRPTPPLDEPVPREHTRGVTWVEPALVGEVAYRTLTPERRLRHPSWRGLRPDRDPDEVMIDA